MRRTLRTAALAAVALLSLSGCLKMEMQFTLHEDDTVDGSIVMAVQKGVGESFGMSDEDVLAQMESEGSFEDIEGGTTEPYDDGEFVGTKVTFDAEPLSELEQQDAGFTLMREGDEFVVGGEFDTGEEDMSMLSGADVTLAVTFPGEVTEHNGTLEGTTVTWDLLTMTEPLNARGAASAGSSFPWLWIGVGAAILLVGAAAAVAIVLARRRPAPAAPAYPAAGYGIDPASQPLDPAQAPGFAPEGAAPQGYVPPAYAPEAGAPPAYAPQPEQAAAEAPSAPQQEANPFAPPATPATPVAPENPAAPENPEEPREGGGQQYPPPSYPPQSPPQQ